MRSIWLGVLGALLSSYGLFWLASNLVLYSGSNDKLQTLGVGEEGNVDSRWRGSLHVQRVGGESRATAKEGWSWGLDEDADATAVLHDFPYSDGGLTLPARESEHDSLPTNLPKTAHSTQQPKSFRVLSGTLSGSKLATAKIIQPKFIASLSFPAQSTNDRALFPNLGHKINHEGAGRTKRHIKAAQMENSEATDDLHDVYLFTDGRLSASRNYDPQPSSANVSMDAEDYDASDETEEFIYQQPMLADSSIPPSTSADDSYFVYSLPTFASASDDIVADLASKLEGEGADQSGNNYSKEHHIEGGSPLLVNVTRSHTAFSPANLIVQHLDTNFTWFSTNDQGLDDDNSDLNKLNTRYGQKEDLWPEGAPFPRQQPHRKAMDCIYEGTIVGIPDSRAVLSFCQPGIFGSLAINETTYFIEPILDAPPADSPSPAQTSEGEWDADRGPPHLMAHVQRPHLLYRHKSQAFHDESSSHNTQSLLRRRNDSSEGEVIRYDGSELRVPSKQGNSSFAGASESETQRFKRSIFPTAHAQGLPLGVYSRDYFVEVLVVADALMQRYHGRDLEHYVLTLMSIVSSVYRHHSLGASINIIVVKLLVLEHENAGPKISDNAKETLRNFCQWQQALNSRDDSMINHHDAAVLLTRQDICRSPGKCDTLGLAELGTMCDGYRSCAIIEDNGLSAAFTIAHELGHLFNIPHDDEKKCRQWMSLEKSNYHIMAPTLEHNTHPWSWSQCSAETLHTFMNLRRNVYCLEDKPGELKYFTQMESQAAPGKTFDVDRQCKFVFGPQAVICPYMPSCKRLWCKINIGSQVGCRTQHMPWADGTVCGYQRWCHKGECVGLAPEQMGPTHGEWGEWNEWSACTRTCGGGIKSASRDCDRPRPLNGGKFCTGMKTRYRPCNMKECSFDAPDFREVQCSEFDGKTMQIHSIKSHVQWTPRYIRILPNQRCSLWCEVLGSPNLYFKLKERVVDGTPCDRYSEDMCINGECVPAGCDHMPSSHIKRDSCGVCAGTDSTCKAVKGHINTRQNYGYNTLVKIPAGATGIDITQTGWQNKAQDENYLALQNSRGEYILNGRFQIDPAPQEIPVQGAILFYSGADTVVERINSSRPVHEDLYLNVLSIGDLNPPDIRFLYHLSDVPIHRTSLPDYKWSFSEEWSTCSKPCQGTQEKTMRCANTNTDEKVSERRCEQQRKPPPAVQQCNLHCTLKWQSNPVSECSVRCGKGHQRQDVICVMATQSGAGTQEVDAQYCPAGDKPPDMGECYKDCAGRKWMYSGWTECPVTCGGGIQRRDAVCTDENNKRLAARECESVPTEAVERQCNILPCPRWVYGYWSECSHSCDGGVQSRSASCQDLQGREVSPQLCNEAEKMDRQACNVQLCTLWEYGEWSECSTSCGRGRATRDSFCADSGHNRLPDSRCDETGRVVSKPCEKSVCPEWKLGNWSSCSRSCKDGWKSRSVMCVDGYGQELDPQYCINTQGARPQTHDPCNQGPCPFWRSQEWGPCSVTCDNGYQSRVVECVWKERSVDVAYCSEGSRPLSTQACSQSACPDWEVEPWEPCSVTCGEGWKTRRVFCHIPTTRQSMSESLCKLNRKPRDRKLCSRKPCWIPTTTTTTTPRPTTAPPAPRIYPTPRLQYAPPSESKNNSPDDDRPTKWITGAWSPCSKDCGIGEQNRAVICRDRYGRILGSEYCSHSAKPFGRQQCDAGPCATWITQPWQPCPATCGRNLRRWRIVRCESPENSNRIPTTTACSGQPKPAVEELCPGLAECPKTPAVETNEIHNDVRRTQMHPESEWRTGSWTECSATCGGGVQMRAVKCVRAHTNESLHDQYCNRVPAPLARRRCNSQACPTARSRDDPDSSYKWDRGNWGPCSAKCGPGKRIREVTCVDGEKRVVEESRCKDLVRPPTQHRCRMARCPRWRAGEWSLCSATCGLGMRTRPVSCFLGRRRKMAAGKCADLPKPPAQAQCHLMACPQYKWLASRWSKCSTDCGRGRQVREVSCLNSLLQRAPARKCETAKKPVAVRECIRTECPFVWEPGQWSSCSKSCDEGMQYRTLHCRLRTQNRTQLVGAELPFSHCELLPKPPVSRECSLGSCGALYYWQMGPWTPCSVTCAWGVQKRRVRCLDSSGKKVRKNLCLKKLRPPRRRACMERNCAATDCREVKKYEKLARDGIYDIFVRGKTMKIYCHAMNESIPKEYIDLVSGSDTNFAEIYGKRLQYPFTCPHGGERNDSCQCTSKGHPRTGLTKYTKIRLDLYNLRVMENDVTFTEQVYGTPVPYATAGDCYSAVNCPQGQFQIDLRSTGFRVSEESHWDEHGHRMAKHIEKFGSGVAVHGKCGGYCGRCFPRRLTGLLLKLVDEPKSKEGSSGQDENSSKETIEKQTKYRG